MGKVAPGSTPTPARLRGKVNVKVKELKGFRAHAGAHRAATWGKATVTSARAPGRSRVKPHQSEGGHIGPQDGCQEVGKEISQRTERCKSRSRTAGIVPTQIAQLPHASNLVFCNELVLLGYGIGDIFHL